MTYTITYECPDTGDFKVDYVRGAKLAKQLVENLRALGWLNVRIAKKSWS